MTTGIRNTENPDNLLVQTQERRKSKTMDENQQPVDQKTVTSRETDVALPVKTDSAIPAITRKYPVIRPYHLTPLSTPENETAPDQITLADPETETSISQAAIRAAEELRVDPPDPSNEPVKQPSRRRIPRIYQGIAVSATCGVLFAAGLGIVHGQTGTSSTARPAAAQQQIPTARTGAGDLPLQTLAYQSRKMHARAMQKPQAKPKAKTKAKAKPQQAAPRVVQPAPVQPTATPVPVQPTPVAQPTATPVAQTQSSTSTNQNAGYYQQMATQAAQQAGINPTYFVRQIQIESGFNPQAVSSDGAVGIAQFMPATAASLGIDPYDPQSSLTGAAQLMARLANQYGGDYSKALAAYNTGEETVNSAIQSGGAQWLSYMPASTQNYIHEIVG